MADVPTFAAHLAKSWPAIIACIDCDHRRTLCRAVTLQRANAETIFKGERQRLGKFFRTYRHKLQAAKIFREAPPGVLLQKRRSRKQKSDPIVANQFADRAQIDRAGMKRNA